MPTAPLPSTGEVWASAVITVAATIVNNMLSRSFMVVVLRVSGHLLWASALENGLLPQVTNIIRFSK